jgi:tetratricopeptide (TPR) repeat protein
MTRTLIVIALLAGLAHADPDRDARAHAAADEGAALFAKNDFAAAAAKFTEAYEHNHDASYLFNIAQAYRHGGDCVRAADYYGRFLSEVPNPPNVEKIRVWYASQMQCAKERTSDTTPPKPVPPPAPAHPNNHRGLVLGLAGTGIVALGVGAFFTWDASYLGDQRAAFLDRCNTENHCSSATVNDYDRRGSRANKLAIAGFAVGSIAVAASVTVFLLSRSETPTPAVAITPIENGAIVTRGFAW